MPDHRSAQRQHVQATSSSRSQSVFRKLKRAVSASFSFLGSTPVPEEFEVEAGQNGKRQRAAADEGIAKRQRVRSPPRQTGYNDPSPSMFEQTQRTQRESSPTNSESSNVTIEDDRPSVPPVSSPTRGQSAVERDWQRRHRRVASAARASSMAHLASGPPRAGPIERDHSMPPPQSVGRMYSSRIRGPPSMTPQPSGQTYHSNEYRSGRSASAQEPSLADIMARPSSYYPSRDVDLRSVSPARHRRTVSMQSAASRLGDIAEGRTFTPDRGLPPREGSAMLVDPQASGYQHPESTREYTPSDTAADTYHRLEKYRTSIHPTRIRAQTPQDVERPPPAMFALSQLNKVHVPRVSAKRKQEEDDDYTLGLLRKKPTTRKDNDGTPYKGQAGYKKLLARHGEGDMEGEESAMKIPKIEDVERGYPLALLQEFNPNSALDLTQESNVDSDTKNPFDLPPPEVPFAPAPFNPIAAASANGSSLRVGRTKDQRLHATISRVASRPSIKAVATRFTASVEDEDDSMDAPDASDEPSKPHFAPPPDFSFAPPTQTPLEPAKDDESKLNDAPIGSLPFTFSRSPSTAPTFTAPIVNLFPPTPEVPKDKDEPKVTAVPNFFANSKYVTEAQPLPKPPAARGNPFGSSPRTPFTASPSPAPPALSAAKPEAAPSAPKPAEASASSYPPNVVPPLVAQPVVTKVSEPDASEVAKPSPTAPLSLSGPKSGAPAPVPPVSAFSFGSSNPPTQPIGSTLGTSFSFGAPKPAVLKELSKANGEQANAPAVSAFTPLFGNASAAPSTFATPISASTSAEQPKSAFSFGAPAATTPTVTEPSKEPAAPKPLFGGASAAFSFGQPAKPTEEPKVEAVKTPFSFGLKPAEDPKVATTPFSFGQKPTEEPKTEAAKAPFSFGLPASGAEAKQASVKASFSFGAAPATPPAVPEVKSPFTFGATVLAAASPAPVPPPAVPASGAGFSFSFGATAPAAADAPKPFSFGSSTAAPARPVTPPKKEDDEVRMDESPSRGNSSMDLYNNVQAPKPTQAAPFTFGNGAPSGSALFGSAPISATTSPFTFGSSPSPAPPPVANTFAFGQKQPEVPSSNGGFSFGAKAESPAPTPNPFNFAQKPGPPAAAPAAFSFGQTAEPSSTKSGFSFGQKQDPSTAGAFAFGNKADAPAANGGFAFAKPTAPTLTTSFSAGSQSTSAPFSFGGGAGPASAPPVTTSQFGFGAPGSGAFAAPSSNAGSAPGTPKAASRAFSFSAPTNTPSNPFALGGGSSQPASPAVPNSGLPGSGGGFAFGTTPTTGTPPPSSHGIANPFASTPSPAPSGGGLFNIGSAPAQPAGARAVKKMPTRRKR